LISFGVVNVIEKESRMIIARDWGGEEKGEFLFNKYRFQFCKMKSIQEMTEVNMIDLMYILPE
jgi:hypothetical protein